MVLKADIGLGVNRSGKLAEGVSARGRRDDWRRQALRARRRAMVAVRASGDSTRSNAARSCHRRIIVSWATSSAPSASLPAPTAAVSATWRSRGTRLMNWFSVIVLWLCYTNMTHKADETKRELTFLTILPTPQQSAELRRSRHAAGG